MLNVLVINGAIGGRVGNTSMLLKKIKKMILKKEEEVKVRIIHLSPSFCWNSVKRSIKKQTV